jgi:hypothetical protein
LEIKTNYSWFEVAKIIGQMLVRNLIDLLDAYGLRNKIIAYVKDEGSNLNTLTNALKSIVKCETLKLEERFQGTYFGHVFS